MADGLSGLATRRLSRRHELPLEAPTPVLFALLAINYGTSLAKLAVNV